MNSGILKKLKKIPTLALAAVLTLASSGCIGIFMRVPKAGEGTVITALSYYVTTQFPDGQSATNNDWTRAIEEELGFKIHYKFAATNVEYDQKIGADIAAGDVPNIFTASVMQAPTLVKADMIHDDLAPIFDEYATPLVKQVMGWHGSVENSPNFQICAVDGKLKGIPWVDSKTDSLYAMYIRKDWLDVVQEDVPVTLSDLERVLRKFQDVYGSKGLGLSNDVIYSNAGAFSPIFNAYGAYPQIWVKKDGKLDYGFFQPEMKEGLRLLRKWYSQGYIFKDFSTSTLDTIASKVAAGEIGVWMGVQSLPLYRTNSSVVNHANEKGGKEADWIVARVPQVDASTPTKLTMTNSISRFHFVQKGYKYPERLVQMINLFVEKMWGEDADFDRFNKIATAYPFQAWPETKNLTAYRNVTAALDIDRASDWWQATRDLKDLPEENTTGFDSEYYKLDSEQKFYYSKIRDYFLFGLDKDGENWGYARVFYAYADENGGEMIDGRTGFDSSQSVIDYYISNEYYLEEAFRHFDTPTMSEYRRSIEDNVDLLIKNIIKGAKGMSVDSFDTEVQKLRNGNAGKIINEVNEFYGNNT